MYQAEDDTVVQPYGGPPPRRRRRWGRGLLITLIVLVVLVVVADRVGNYVAERTVASQVKSQLAAQGVTIAGDPDVAIDGVPFLTQVVAGKYGKVTITVKDLVTHGIQLDRLDVTSTDVSAPTQSMLAGHVSIKAAHVVGTGTIAWTSVQQMIDSSGLQKYGIDPTQLHISGTDAGDITISASASQLGQSFTTKATGRLTVAAGVVTVAISKVTTSPDSLPGVEIPIAGIQNALTFPVVIPALPYGMKVTSVVASSTGVIITADASDVVLGH